MNLISSCGYFNLEMFSKLKIISEHFTSILIFLLYMYNKTETQREMETRV